VEWLGGLENEEEQAMTRPYPLFAAVVLLVVSCGGRTSQSANDEPGAAPAIPFSAIKAPCPTDYETIVVRTAADWHLLYVPEISPDDLPIVDFERNMIIVVGGRSGMPGDDIRIERVEDRGDHLNVKWRWIPAKHYSAALVIVCDTAVLAADARSVTFESITVPDD
jgi:hypothetical protein